MPTLKATYPLYLNNRPVQPNTDLAVTDKFTGEVGRLRDELTAQGIEVMDGDPLGWEWKLG